MFGDILLGIIQGLTEFLPVSSSGHLALTSSILGSVDEDLLFELLLHFGTLVAVIIVFYKKLWDTFKGVLTGDKKAIRYTLLVVAASVPTAIIGFTFEKKVAHLSSLPLAVCGLLFLTGLALYSTKKAPNIVDEEYQMSFKQAFLIGLIQGIAILPGVSRSGSTITAALWLKVPRKMAGEFSFIMSIPVIGGAVLLHVKDAFEAGNLGASLSLDPLLGVLASFLSGLISLIYLMKFIQKGQLHQFAYYLWPLSIISAVYFGFMA